MMCPHAYTADWCAVREEAGQTTENPRRGKEDCAHRIPQESSSPTIHEQELWTGQMASQPEAFRRTACRDGQDEPQQGR